jgi:hypothetical protein
MILIAGPAGMCRNLTLKLQLTEISAAVLHVFYYVLYG